MKRRIELASETIPKSHIDQLSAWLNKYPRLTKSVETEKFESLFAKYITTKKAKLVNSGSSANLLLAAANLYFENLKNKKVAIPAVSWSTTLSPFIQLGYTPFLLDCNSKDLGIDVDQFYKLAKEQDISTLILVHVLGHDASIEKCIDIADQFNIRLFEDSCEALGSSCNNKKLGSWGLASSFSFYYGHHISTIEGGCVCTNNEMFSELVTSLRSHGWSRDLDKGVANQLKDKYEISDFRDLYSFYYPGFNFRSTEINAYLGILQLNLIEAYSKKRASLFKRYSKNLNNFWCQYSASNFISSFAYGTFVKNSREVWLYLKEKGIESRPLICGSMGLQPYWKEYNNGSYTSLKNADKVHEFGIYLPINADLNEEEVDYVCKVFCEIAVPFEFS